VGGGGGGSRVSRPEYETDLLTCVYYLGKGSFASIPPVRLDARDEATFRCVMVIFLVVLIPIFSF